MPRWWPPSWTSQASASEGSPKNAMEYCPSESSVLVDDATFAPTHLGSQPAVSTDEDGDEVQPLAGTYETAFTFYDSLTDEQKDLLLDVMANWVGLSDEETTAAALAEIEATLDETYVSWSGATVYDMTQGDGISFQISGPDVYVEFSNQQGSAGADVSGYLTSGWGHIHAIYRDPSEDYAGSVTQQTATGMGGGAAPGGDGAMPSGGPGGDASDEG